MAEDVEIQDPPQVGQDDGNKGVLPPFLRGKQPAAAPQPTDQGGTLPPFLRGKQNTPSYIPPTAAGKDPIKPINIGDLPAPNMQTVYTGPGGEALLHSNPMQPMAQDATRAPLIGDVGHILPGGDMNDHKATLLSLAQQRLPTVLKAQAPGIVKQLALKDMQGQIKDLYIHAQTAGMTPDQIDKDRNDILAKYIGDGTTPTQEDIMKSQVGTDPLMTHRVVESIRKTNPALAKQIDQDSYIINAKDRDATVAQQVKNVRGIQSGDLTYNHITDQIEKPLGFWGSLGYGARKATEEKQGYDKFVDGDPTENIKQLEIQRAMHNPDDPKEVPVGMGKGGAMIGGNALPMAEAGIASGVASMAGVPELSGLINSAILGPDAYKKSWYNSYTNTYNELRNRGVPQVDAERESRTQAERDAKLDAAGTIIASVVGGHMGAPEAGAGENAAINTALDQPGLGNGLMEDSGNIIHTSAVPFDPAYTRALNKVATNTIGDKTANLAKKVITEGGPVSALNAGIQGIKNQMDNKPSDEGSSQAFWGNMLFTGALGAIAKGPEFLTGIPKENIVPEMNPETEEGAKLFIDQPTDPNAPVLAPGQGKTAQRLAALESQVSDLLNQAKGEIGKGGIQGVSKPVLEEAAKDPDKLSQALKEVSDQANDPTTAQAAETTYGKPLVDIAKQVSDIKDQQANVPPEPAEAAPGDPIPAGLEQQGTGIKNAASRALRGDLNLPSVDLPKIGNDREILQNGKDLVESGKVVPSELITKILADPAEAKKGMDSDESAAMQYHMHQLAKAENDTRAAYNAATEPAVKDELGLNLQQIKDRSDAATQANMLAGTDWSKVGRTRQVMADAGFNPYREKAVIKEAYGGNIPADVQKNIDAILKERDDALGDMDKLRQQAHDMENSANPDEQVQKMTGAQMIAAQTKVNNANSKLQQARIKALNSNQSQLQRGMSFVNRWERRTVLSGLPVLEKLSDAATIGSAAQQLPEYMVGNFWSNVFQGIAKQAPIEGFPNAKSLGKYYSEMFDGEKFLKNTADIYKTGSTDLVRELGSPHEHYAWYDALLDTHQVIKDPVKRAKFESALSQYTSWAENQPNMDVNHPLVMEYMRQQAYKRAEYEIFQDDSKLSSWFNKTTENFSKGGTGDQVKAALMKFMVPVNKVPLNIARRMGISVLGVPKGLWDVGAAYRKGIQSLEPEHADMIMRELTKGSTGLAYWLAGALMYKEIGGLYTKYDRATKDSGPQYGEMSLGGVNIPKPLQHALPFQLMNSGATFNHIWDKFREDNHSIARSFINAAKGTTGATLGEIPMVQEPVNFVQGLTDPYMGNRFDQDMERRFIPQITRDAGIVPKDFHFLSTDKAEKAAAVPTSGHQ